MKYALVDLSNLFSRCRFVIKSDGDPYTKGAITISMVFKSLRKIYRDFGLDHVVIAVDSGSWRYGVYPMYKAKRKLHKLDMTEEQRQEDEVIFTYLNELVEYFNTKTKCTVLKTSVMEADDLIAGFIQSHSEDEHIIISADSDFIQLLDNNVKIYDGVSDRLLTTEGVFDSHKRKMEFKVDSASGKVKILKVNEFFEPEEDWWKKSLFVKIVRGDSGDGIFSAYPGISFKGTTKRIGIQQAWEDRKVKGFHWNNFMLQEWKKAVGSRENGDVIYENAKVIDGFKFNEKLIDLTKQPDDIKIKINEAIQKATKKEVDSKSIGFNFLRFCQKYDLPGLMEETDHVNYLNLGYKNV